MSKVNAGKYLLTLLRYAFSFVAAKEYIYLFSYYIVNHVAGVAKVHKKRGARIRPTAFLRDAQNIYIGENSTINHLCCLWAGKKDAKIVIGDNVMLGPGVKMFAFRHGTAPGKIMIEQDYSEADIIIGNDIWIGADALIMPGVKIGDGCVVGAGSVVSRDLPSNTISVGAPAIPIKQRA